MRLSPLLLLAALALTTPSAWAITYADWIASYGLTGANALTTADPDGDTLPNLLEYALADCDPANPASGTADLPRLPKLVFGQRSGNGLPSVNPYNISYTGFTAPPTGTFHIGLRYRPRPGTEGLRMEAQYSRDLTTGWYGGRNAYVVSPETPIVGDAVQWSLAAYDAPSWRGSKHFLRLACSPWENAPASTIPVGGPQLWGAPAQGLLVLAPVVQSRALADTGSESTLEIVDRLVRRTAAATSVSDYYWRWDPLGTNTQPVVLVRTSSDTSVLAPDAGDPYLWRWTGNGTATITLATSTSNYSTTVTASTTTPQNVDTVTGFAPASLRSHLVAQIDPLLAGKNASAMPIYTAQDHAAGIYLRNPNCWAAPYVGQLTAISPWNSQGGAYLAGVLVSPRHVLFATHYAAGAGATMRFIAADNTVITRTLTATAPLPGYVPYYPDLTVGVLDSDVPGTIAFARILPDDWPAKLPALTGTTGGDTLQVPSLGLDQEEKAIVSDLAPSSMSTSVSFARPAAPLRSAFYEDKIGGDSGNPVFLIINGQLVLLTCWTYGGGGSGTSVHYQRAAINTLMTTLGGGYQLTPADLSGFPSY